MKKNFFLLVIFISSYTFSQHDSINVFKIGNPYFQYNQKRVKQLAYTQVIAYTANFASLYSLWYKDYPKSNFHFFNDLPEYLQVDKVSHMWGTYTAGNINMQMWKWAGVSKKKYVWLGGLSGLAYETVIEVMDGFSEHWGFSLADYGANVIGTGLLIGQELAWNEQRITFKFGAHIANYPDPVVNNYLNRIYGKSKIERLLKDYNSQTYWLSANIKSFIPKAKVPNWLNVAFGYGGQDMMGARWDGILDANGHHYDTLTYNRYRQWYLAPDIDLTRIKTKSKFLKTVLFVLNSFKFPTPSIELSQGRLKFNWLHF